MPSMLLKANIIAALKQNIGPGITLQLFALIILLTYFYWPESHLVFNLLIKMKTTYGWCYSAVSTMIFGGLIPFLYLYVNGKIPINHAKHFFFYTIFWAIKGVEVDFFYQLQGYWFGNDANFQTIAIKTIIDQFIYSALWAAPGITIIYLWKDSEFNFNKWRRQLNNELWQIKIPTVVVSNWLIWIPAVSIIYTMPAALQLPMFNLVLCFFVLLLASVTRSR